MKQLQKSDLKEGEIYKQLELNYIFLYNKNETSNSFNDGTAISTYTLRYYKRWSGNRFIAPMVEATSEEKHWLKECIKANKFVSYKKAMKTFVPEYVECIKQLPGITIGKILHVENNMVIDGEFNNYSMKANDIYNYFKPSTKEAYDAQFVVKEKENTTVTEKPKVVFEEPKDKALTLSSNYGKESIVKVECSEGGIYKIGDKIRVFTHNSPNKGKVFTIKGFRWNNAKTNLCAITELHSPNGIGLDKIELYVEPKVKIVDDFVLPEKWCVEVNQEIRFKFNYYFAEGYHHSIQINDTNKWSYNIKEGFTEITFEQFKKYVLKDE